MKLFVLGAALAASPMLVPAAQSAFQPVPTEMGLPQRNLLGNGGFESWSLGTSVQGPLAPDLWYAMGTAAGAFVQTDIAYTQVAENASCGPDGPWCADVRANKPENFVAQRLEDFSGLAGQWVTFSVDLRTPFGIASPTIAIDDGVGASSKTEIVDGSVERITVRHLVSACATKLEFRIHPDQTVRVDNAMAVVGKHAGALYVPRGNAGRDSAQVPLGTVIDWYRFDESVPVPDGFEICDGSAIDDEESPFDGQPTPNLAGRFVRGVTMVDDIGDTGGADTTSIAHTHPIPHTHNGNTTGPSTLFDVPCGGPCVVANFNHDHDFTTGGPSNANSGASSVANVSIVPSYVGLLKIVRIK